MHSDLNQLSGDRSVSVILPIYNEQETLADVLSELRVCLLELQCPFEILCVDDGSTDDSHERLLKLQQTEIPEMRILRLSRNCGQSAAFDAGFANAKHAIVITMDADGQNDPHDIPLLLDGLEHADLCCGYRQTRQDHLSKIIASRIGNSIRNRALRSTIIDTGCSLKAFRKEALTGIRLYQGMHRFLPDLCRLHNQAVITQIPVHHRPRKGGKSKYSNWGRFLKTVPDLFAVRWMTQRHQDYSVTEE